ncbi:hypothetical protein [Hymenobacter rubripertinctus]|uniref:Uncharacterized protein n=1 Tax=Hymenobacter rubripertinctus TaxID=2029981 RepID=A0A418R0T0_9BACT|nr:hypothetical protein [Hymenobacter rubripertinctus]RIY11027.1 hypothetical protein D0T11_08440 [Hymenobacter rubripertinctus]
MKFLHKTQRLFATGLLMVLLLTASLQNAVAFGSYTQISTPSSAQQLQMEPAVFPAVAAVAFGVVVVGAFAYGVYTGYTEASSGGAQVLSAATLDMYQSDDFSRFDLTSAAI